MNQFLNYMTKDQKLSPLYVGNKNPVRTSNWKQTAIQHFTVGREKIVVEIEETILQLKYL